MRYVVTFTDGRVRELKEEQSSIIVTEHDYPVLVTGAGFVRFGFSDGKEVYYNVDEVKQIEKYPAGDS